MDNTQIITEKICETCGHNKQVKKSTITNTYLCGKCRPKKQEPCFICKQKKRVNNRDENGNPICLNCRRKSSEVKEHCFLCFKKRYPVIRDNQGNPYCGTCYQYYYINPSLQEICSICSEQKVIFNYENNKPICQTCSRTPKT